MIATALAKAYNNPHAKAVIIEAESGGGGPSDAIIIYRQINALKNHQPQIERVSDAGCSLSSVAADKSNKTGSTERGDEARSKQNSSKYSPAVPVVFSLISQTHINQSSLV